MENKQDKSKKVSLKPSFRIVIIGAGFLLPVFFLLLSSSIQKPLDHDEHQFIAAGMLLAKHFSFPYLDYAYFHMPNLVFINAALFTFTDHLLLSARLFSTLCTWLTLVIIFFTAFHLFRNYSSFIGFLFAICSVVILLINPVFVYTVGKAWNHDLPILLTLVALILFSEGIKRENKRRWFFASGLMIGLAIGTRLTFAPIVLPFLIMFFLLPRRLGNKELVKQILAFVLGLFVGLLPSVVLFTLAPRQFMFGNFGYAAYNTLYRQQQGFSEGT